MRCNRRISPIRRRGRGTPRSIASCRGRCAARSRTSGRSASHLERARNINQLQPGTIQGNPGVNTNALRPYLGFSTITLYETTGTSRYNSLQAQVERRGTRGVGFSVAYTFSRTTDNGAGRDDILPNAYDDSGYYGISDLDRPHVLVSQVRYRFPTLESSRGAAALGARQLGCLGHLPGAVRRAIQRDRTTVDIAGVGPGSGNQFYEQIGDPTAVRTDWDPLRWRERRGSIETRVPRSHDRHVSPRRQEKNSLRQPGFWDVNMSFRKGFNVTGTQRFDLRIEAFNILNRTRLGNAVTNPTLPRLRVHHVEGRQPDDADRPAVPVLIGGRPLKFRSTPPPPGPGGGSSPSHLTSLARIVLRALHECAYAPCAIRTAFRQAKVHR